MNTKSLLKHDLLEHLEDIWVETTAIRKEAREKHDARNELDALGVGLQVLELVAKLQGELPGDRQEEGLRWEAVESEHQGRKRAH
ncbi:MAG: hypothetical protein AB1714_11230 [Acidobacteriota bacterium]